MTCADRDDAYRGPLCGLQWTEFRRLIQRLGAKEVIYQYATQITASPELIRAPLTTLRIRAEAIEPEVLLMLKAF